MNPEETPGAVGRKFPDVWKIKKEKHNAFPLLFLQPVPVVAEYIFKPLLGDCIQDAHSFQIRSTEHFIHALYTVCVILTRFLIFSFFYAHKKHLSFSDVFQFIVVNALMRCRNPDRVCINDILRIIG